MDFREKRLYQQIHPVKLVTDVAVTYALHITEKGRSTLETIRRISREHSQAVLAAISEDEQRQLATLLQRIADQQGLSRGVHPGYRRTAKAGVLAR
jgi:hypothetical protein